MLLLYDQYDEIHFLYRAGPFDCGDISAKKKKQQSYKSFYVMNPLVQLRKVFFDMKADVECNIWQDFTCRRMMGVVVINFHFFYLLTLSKSEFCEKFMKRVFIYNTKMMTNLSQYPFSMRG